MAARRESPQRLTAFLDAIGPVAAFEALAELVPDSAVFAVDADRNVLLWSAGAERLLGYPRDEVIGRLCLSGIRCRNCMVGCGIAKYGSVDGMTLELFRADESWVRVRKHARAFYDESGVFSGAIELLVPTGDPVEAEPPRRRLPREAEEFHGLRSRDPVMRRAFQMVRNVAETDATVLVRGESGTGKERVARALHAESHRRRRPFVAVNCGALTPALTERELFGHVKGAFPGAVSDREGVFRQADGGTLFLDDVTELPLDVQRQLLQVLDVRTFRPVGGTHAVEVDVRIVVATRCALQREVRRGMFREDLMDRLRAVPIFLPPLAERVGDIELLLRHFLDEFNAAGHRHIARVAPEAMRALLDHAWPGNVRELRNVVEYAFAVGRGTDLRRDDLPPQLREPRGPSPIDPAGAAPAEGEAERIRRALDQARGRINEAAAKLGMSRATFWRKRKRYGL
jgi:DNA-binding NtrC family response regulator